MPLQLYVPRAVLCVETETVCLVLLEMHIKLYEILQHFQSLLSILHFFRVTDSFLNVSAPAPRGNTRCNNNFDTRTTSVRITKRCH